MTLKDKINVSSTYEDINPSTDFNLFSILTGTRLSFFGGYLKEKLFGYDFSTCSLSATRNQAKFLATRRSRLDLTSGKCIRFALFTIRPLVAQFEVTKRP